MTHLSCRKILAVPIVDSIKWYDLHQKAIYRDGALYKGIFEWGFLYKEMPVDAFGSHAVSSDKNRRFSSPYWYVIKHFAPPNQT